MTILSFKSFFAFITILSFVIISCGNNYNEVLLHGKWKTHDWTVKTTGKKVTGQMDFEFNTNGEYLIDYGSQNEKGKYWITADYLHTVETGQSEKSVKVLKLTKDSFHFQMNRAGSLEEVLLLKQD